MIAYITIYRISIALSVTERRILHCDLQSVVKLAPIMLIAGVEPALLRCERNVLSGTLNEQWSHGGAESFLHYTYGGDDSNFPPVWLHNCESWTQTNHSILKLRRKGLNLQKSRFRAERICQFSNSALVDGGKIGSLFLHAATIR